MVMMMNPWHPVIDFSMAVDIAPCVLKDGPMFGRLHVLCKNIFSARPAALKWNFSPTSPSSFPDDGGRESL
jgi:hypothetical protein